MQPLDIAMGNKSKKNGKKNGKKNDKKNDKNRLKKLQTLRKKNK
jgi:hypothetical protein